jgi:hypothetical protein
MHLSTSSKQNGNVMKNGFFFFMVEETYLGLYNFLNISNKIPLISSITHKFGFCSIWNFAMWTRALHSCIIIQ